VGILHIRHRKEFQTIGVTMKTCSKCKKEMPFSEFHKDSRTKSGYRAYCKTCRIPVDRKYYHRTKERWSAHGKTYRTNQPAGVYKIVNKIDGKMYIGQSTVIKERINSHKTRLRNKRHSSSQLQNVYDKHDSLDVFEFTIIEQHASDTTTEFLLERERYFINKYKEEGKELYNVD